MNYCKLRYCNFFLLLVIISLQACSCKHTPLQQKNQQKMSYKVNKSASEWEEVLTPQQFKILRKKGTDLPGTGAYTYHFEDGEYRCAACNALLFKSSTKYESHCGWPSFDDAVEGAIIQQPDYSHNRIRTEIICSNCGGHLGHIFDDGPVETTGKRYCVNSTSLQFTPKK